MSATAVPDVPARALPRLRVERLLLVLFASAGVVGVLKGLAPTLVESSEYYWLLAYDHGFIRRGLIGTLFRPLLHVWSFDQLKPLVMIGHIVACLWIIYVCYRLFQQAVGCESELETRLALTFSFLCLMCSQLMPTLAHDVGYVDVYLMSLALGGFWLVLNEQYVAAACVATVGPFVHEAFAFLWSPVAILLVWSALTRRTDATKKIAVALLPILAAGLVLYLHSETAVRLAVEAAPIDEKAKGPLLDYIFGQTLVSAFRHMMRYDFRDDLSNFLTATAYFLPPTLVIFWAAVYCYGKRWAWRWGTAATAAAATVCPLAIVVIAWDLSRFLVWATFASAIVLIGVGAPGLTAMRART